MGDASMLFSIVISVLCLSRVVLVSASAQHHLASRYLPQDPVAKQVVARALADGINLAELPFSAAALKEIVFWNHFEPTTPQSKKCNSDSGGIDVHTHYVPQWYAELRGDTTKWDLDDHLTLMADQSIAKSILSVSDPNILPGNEIATLAIARLLNENLAALARALPHCFGFFGSVPLPHTHAAIVEGKHALKNLGAQGLALSSNHEGLYLGNPLFTAFFAAVDAHKGMSCFHPGLLGRFGDANSRPAILFLHPHEPVLYIDGHFENANPTNYSAILGEFYFETARTTKSALQPPGGCFRC
ncbi:Amidohydro-rel domain-containing protein [Mycena kentingensis (nom. inval.)]|nr:Amidohydro-rel domain-containing protein [Mycena kentingensis (nom. inval.)]